MTVLVRPALGRETQPFATRQLQDGQPHAGTDFGITDATGKRRPEVFAAAAGQVVYAGDSKAMGWPNISYTNVDFNRGDGVDTSAGNIVVIDHGGGLTTYNHLAAWTVRKGQWVEQGQHIATIGATGNANGEHLHFEWIPRPFNFGTATYGRARPSFATIAPQGALAGGFLMALDSKQQDQLAADVKDIKAFIADVNTSTGKVGFRQFLVNGVRAAEAARDNTQDITTDAGPVSLRTFVAQGTRAAQAVRDKVLGK